MVEELDRKIKALKHEVWSGYFHLGFLIAFSGLAITLFFMGEMTNALLALVVTYLGDINERLDKQQR